MASSSVHVVQCSSKSDRQTADNELYVHENDGDDIDRDPDYFCSTSDYSENQENEVNDGVSRLLILHVKHVNYCI